MEATAAGPNRTGAAIAPDQVKLMLEAVDELSPPSAISTLQMDIERQSYIKEADSVGSISPPGQGPATKKSKAKGKQATQQPEALAILLDKLGERIAFERTGARLYDALITKYLALTNTQAASASGAKPIAPETEEVTNGEAAGNGVMAGEEALNTLRRIRAEELSHFRLLCDTVQELGGDPTSQTPCADVTAAASMGLMQVITDPRTTLAQCLNTILTAELTDNAGWELLSQLATNAGHQQLTERFAVALEAEAEHLETIRSWLQSLVLNDVGSPAV